MAGNSSLVARARVLLEADTRQFKRDMDAAERKAHATGRALKAGLAVGVAGAAAGLYELGKAARIGFDEFEQGQRVAAQTNAVLKSTGRVANVTEKDVDRLALALMRKSGVDDELIKSGENMLLTFTNIRNEAGKGNDIFSQTTKTLLDMSVATGQEMPKAAVMLGKAINDPIAGMSALSRVGVTFTQQQKDQIRTLVESGRTMDAQKVILRELQKEYGGSAAAAGKTFGGQIEILRQRLNNFLGDLVGKAIPYLERFVKWVDQHSAAMAKFARDLTDAIAPTVEALAGAVRRIAAALDFVSDKLGGWKKTMELTVGAVIGLWAGFKIKAIADAVAIAVANEGAAATVKAAWRGALISTGWGALAVAAGIAVEQILAHWQRVKDWFANLWLGLKEAALRAYLFVIEPFTHLPKGLGEWARRGKAAFEFELRKIEIEKFLRVSDQRARSMGAAAAGAWAAGFLARITGDHPAATATGALGGKNKDGLISSVTQNVGVAGNPGGLKPMILDDLALARRYGLHLTSGYRPGAVTSTGHRSLHAVGQAIDVAGAPAAMAMYAQAEAGRSGVAEILYTPVGGWYPGVGWTRLSGQLARDHYSHVHVGVRGADGIVGAGDGILSPLSRRVTSTRTVGSIAAALQKNPPPKTPQQQAAAKYSVPAPRKAGKNAPKFTLVGASKASSTSTVSPAARAAISLAEHATSASEAYQGYYDAVNALQAQLASTSLSPARRRELQNLLNVIVRRRDLALAQVFDEMRRYEEANDYDYGYGYGGLGGGGDSNGIGGSGQYVGEDTGNRVYAGSPADLPPDAGRQFWAGPGFYKKIKMAPTVPGGGRNSEWIREDMYGGPDTSDAYLSAEAAAESGGGGLLAGAGGLSEADVQERILMERDAVLANRSRFISEFAPNIFSPGPAGLELGSSWGGNITYMTVNFQKPPPDSYSWIRQTQFAAGR